MANELGQIIEAEVGRAETDYQTVRTRALSILGVAGGLVTLVTGLMAVAIGAPKAEVVLHGSARWALLAALTSFVAATVCGLLINLPQEVVAFDIDDLKRKVENEWDAKDWDQQGASIHVDYLGSLRKNNALTARLLLAAILFQIIGIAGVATTAMLVIRDSARSTRPACVASSFVKNCAPK